jgi:hypothetical protein
MKRDLINRMNDFNELLNYCDIGDRNSMSTIHQNSHYIDEKKKSIFFLVDEITSYRIET